MPLRPAAVLAFLLLALPSSGRGMFFQLSRSFEGTLSDKVRLSREFAPVDGSGVPVFRGTFTRTAAGDGASTLTMWVPEILSGGKRSLILTVPARDTAVAREEPPSDRPGLPAYAFFIPDAGTYTGGRTLAAFRDAAADPVSFLRRLGAPPPGPDDPELLIAGLSCPAPDALEVSYRTWTRDDAGAWRLGTDGAGDVDTRPLARVGRWDPVGLPVRAAKIGVYVLDCITLPGQAAFALLGFLFSK
jgi:hypothetical protein